MLFQPLFSTELLGFISLQWNWIKGTMPSAVSTSSKSSMTTGSDHSPGIARSRKRIITDVDIYASYVCTWENNIVKYKAKNRSWRGLQTEHMNPFNFILKTRS